MLIVSDVVSALEQLAPYSLAEEWDNCGLQCGSPDREVTGCLVALDVTLPAIRHAQRMGANLIVTHHPLIFRPLKSISGEDRICRLISAGIASVSAHTNLDRAAGGVNDALFDALGLAGPVKLDSGMRIGTLPAETSLPELADYVRERLRSPQVEYLGEGRVRRAAVFSGAGGDAWEEAKKASADVLITGEAKHNEWIDAWNHGFPMVAAGHHFTEQVVLEPLKRYLSGKFPGMPVEICGAFPLRAAGAATSETQPPDLPPF